MCVYQYVSHTMSFRSTWPICLKAFTNVMSLDIIFHFVPPTIKRVDLSKVVHTFPFGSTTELFLAKRAKFVTVLDYKHSL